MYVVSMMEQKSLCMWIGRAVFHNNQIQHVYFVEIVKFDAIYKNKNKKIKTLCMLYVTLWRFEQIIRPNDKGLNQRS